MPFDPNSGAWISGGDHPWNMPSTSAGDVIGGFNSYDVFQQNQEQAKLHSLMQQLQLERGQYEFGQEQDQADKWDTFQATVARHPEMDQNDLERMLIAASPEKGALAAVTNVNSRRDATNRVQLQKDIKLFNDNVTTGALDPQMAKAKFLELHPDQTYAAEAIGSLKMAPKTGAQIDKIQADTRLTGDKADLLEQITPTTIEGAKLKNDILRAKRALLGVSTSAGVQADKMKLSAARLVLATASKMRDEQYTNQIMKQGDPVHDAAQKEIIDLLPRAIEILNSVGQTAPKPGVHSSPQTNIDLSKFEQQ